jgi:hypothetical protein
MNRRLSLGRAVLFLILVWALLLPLEGRAATGLSFLQIGAGGRSIAFGNAVVSGVQDASATYWNPGALPLLSGNEFEISHTESMQGVRTEFLSLTRQTGRHGFGAAFNGLWTDRLRGFDDQGEYTGDFGYYDVALAGSYGFALTDKIGLGASVEYLREVIDVYSASGLGFGFGVQAREVFPRVSFGLDVRHLGSDMKFVDQSFSLPATIQGGATFRLPTGIAGGRFLLGLELEKVRDSSGRVLVGTEYEYQEMFRLQIGYRSGMDTQDFSMGLGVGNKGLRGQYAFVPYGDNLGNQQRISLSFAF